MLRLVESTSSLKELARRIYNKRSEAAVIFNGIHSKLKGFNDFNFYVPTSQSSSGNSVFMLPNSASQNDYAGIMFTSDPKDKELTYEILCNSPDIDWTSGIRFELIAEEFAEMVKIVMKEKNLKFIELKRLLYAYEYDKDNLPPIRVPAGYELCKLNKIGIDILYDSWPYKSVTSKEYFLRNHDLLPSMGIFENKNITTDTFLQLNELYEIPLTSENRIPVSWASHTSSGRSVAAGTNELHRKKGLAILGMNFMAQLTLLQGYIGIGFILRSQATSKDGIRKFPNFVHNEPNYSTFYTKPLS